MVGIYGSQAFMNSWSAGQEPYSTNSPHQQAASELLRLKFDTTPMKLDLVGLARPAQCESPTAFGVLNSARPWLKTVTTTCTHTLVKDAVKFQYAN